MSLSKIWALGYWQYMGKTVSVLSFRFQIHRESVAAYYHLHFCSNYDIKLLSRGLITKQNSLVRKFPLRETCNNLTSLMAHATIAATCIYWNVNSFSPDTTNEWLWKSTSCTLLIFNGVSCRCNRECISKFMCVGVCVFLSTCAFAHACVPGCMCVCCFVIWTSFLLCPQL